jgi:hypothetical protein
MERIWEYRIKYNAEKDHSALDSYHYYNAENAHDAYEYEIESMRNRGQEYQIISVEKKCPYRDSWLDETEYAISND